MLSRPMFNLLANVAAKLTQLNRLHRHYRTACKASRIACVLYGLGLVEAKIPARLRTAGGAS